MSIWWLLSVIAGASLFLTGILRHYALRRSILDIPNERSSHTIPTPRGGGLAIVLAFLAALPVLVWSGHLTWIVFSTLLGAGVIVAIIGFVDDLGGVVARYRLLSHFLAALWVMLWLGALPPLTLFGTHVELGWFGYVVVALYLVWLLNLYNFMDGIDGLASVEAITVCLGGALLYILHGYWNHALIVLSLASAVAGFLFWNFPPARIFMGDAGSGFLGMVLGILSLQAAWVEGKLFWSWVILLGVFIVDATCTLMRRLLRGDKVYEAHRSHAYQYAARHYGKHASVTCSVFVINVVWLLPIALLVGLGWLDGLVGVMIAYAPLLVLALKFRAGQLEA